MLSLVLANAPLKSLVISLISRCAQVKQKSSQLQAGSILPVFECTLGVLAPVEELSSFVRNLLLNIFRHMSLRSLTMVWLDAPPEFEPITTERVRIVPRAEAPVSCVIDLGVLARCSSVAEMQHCMDKWVRAGTQIPVITLTPRWERLLAWVEASRAGALPKDRGVSVEALGHLSRISFDSVPGAAISVPTITGSLFETWNDPQVVVQRAQLSLPDSTSQSLSTVPFPMLALAAQQGLFKAVFDTPLDAAIVRMAQKKMSRTGLVVDGSMHASGPEKLVDVWNRSIDFLGCMRLTVWIQDTERRAHGIVAAALDAWTVGSTTWPI